MNGRVARFVVFLFGLAVLVGPGGLVAQKATPPNTQKPNVPPAPPYSNLLPDVAVLDLADTLERTELGQGVEFPHDYIRVKGTIKNVGFAPVPTGGSIAFELKRDALVLQTITLTGVLGAPGSTYTYSYLDNVIHGTIPQCIYTLTVTPSFKEMTAENNSLRRGGSEPNWHSNGPGPDMTIADLSVLRENRTTGPFFHFTVKLENLGLGYIPMGDYIKVDIVTESGSIIYAAEATVNYTDAPPPKEKRSVQINVDGAKMPKGTYAVRARVSPDYDANPANNTSIQSVKIVN